METLSKLWASAHDSLERVELPRRTVLRNVRLGLALKVMQLGACAFVLWMLVTNATWAKVVEPTRMGVLTAWDDTSDDEYIAKDEVDRGLAMCTSPQLYDYVYSSKWRYENYSCVTPVVPAERFRKEGDSTVFVPTAWEETHYQLVPVPGTPGACADVAEPCPGGAWQPQPAGGGCACSSVTSHFVTGVGALAMAFDHGYEMTSAASNALIDEEEKSAQRSDMSCEADGGICDAQDASDGQTKELRTVLVVRGPGGKESLLGIFDAPSTIRAQLDDILSKADVGLDDEFLTLSNLLSCQTPGVESPCRNDVRLSPAVRQTGLALHVHLQYANKYVNLDLPCSDCLDNHVGPICKATIDVVPGWNSRPWQDCAAPRRSATGEAGCTMMYYQGISIKFTASGSFGVIDPIFILVSIGAGIVYLSIPLIIINAVAMYLLGALSEVYRKADKEEVSVSSQLAGFVARMITAQTAYSLVTGGDGLPLTKEMLLDRIQLSLERSGQEALDEQEQIRLAEIVVHSLQGSEGTIQMHHFVEAVSSNDPVSLKDAIQLFDVDRRPSFLERLFTPKTWIAQADCLFDKLADGSYNVDAIRKQVHDQRDGVSSRSAGLSPVCSPTRTRAPSPRARPPPRRGAGRAGRAPEAIGEGDERVMV